MNRSYDFFSASRLSTLLWVIAFTLLLLMSGCDNGGGSDGTTGGSVDATVATIKISPGGLMFTATGESRRLTATAYNAAGEVLDVSDFTWEVSKSGVVEVDASGIATSTTSLGSAMITAHAEGVSSTPLLVTVTQPVSGAVLVDDAQVVGDIRPKDPGSPIIVGSHYDVTLTGVSAPAVGDILIGTGEAAVAGRVYAVSKQAGNIVVTLELVPLDELFTGFEINESIPLSFKDMVIDEDIAATYDVVENPDGSLSFTPRPGTGPGVKAARVSSARAGATGTGIRSGPFGCTTTLSVIPFRLTVSPTFTLTQSLSYVVNFSAGSSYKKLAVTGDYQADASIALALTSSISGKVTCEKRLTWLTIPIGGPASFFFGGYVPLGVGMEVGGTIDLTGLGVEKKFKGEATITMGIECPAGILDCDLQKDYDSRSKFETKWTLPSTSISNSLRLKPSLSGYGFVNLEIGIRRPSVALLEVLTSKIGLNMAGTLAVIAGQIEDTAFAADYKLSLEGSIGPGSAVVNFMNYFGLNMAGAAVTFTHPLFASPAALSVRADADQFFQMDPINFKVKLDPATVDFLGVYNVTRVVIYRREMDLFGDVTAQYISSATPAAPGQTEFDMSWFADEDGWISNGDYYAFIQTRFLPFPYFDELELAEVTASPTTLSMEVNLPTTIASNGSATLDIIAGEEQANGLIQGIENLDVTLQVTGGSASLLQGRTDTNGRFSTQITPAADATRVEVQIQVQDSRQTSSVTETVSARVVCGYCLDFPGTYIGPVSNVETNSDARTTWGNWYTYSRDWDGECYPEYYSFEYFDPGRIVVSQTDNEYTIYFYIPKVSSDLSNYLYEYKWYYYKFIAPASATPVIGTGVEYGEYNGWYHRSSGAFLPQQTRFIYAELNGDTLTGAYITGDCQWYEYSMNRQ